MREGWGVVACGGYKPFLKCFCSVWKLLDGCGCKQEALFNLVLNPFGI